MTLIVKRREVEKKKLCKGCGVVKPYSSFHPDATYAKKGIFIPRYLCKLCMNAQSRAWHLKNPTNEERQRRNKNNTLRRKYKITLEQFEEMLDNQGGRCAICNRSAEDDIYTFCVDHDHSCCSGGTSCGECLRGIICLVCNLALGYVKDDVICLENMVQYLLSWEADKELAMLKPTYGLPSKRKPPYQT
jgi:hypothetical protein